MTSATEQFFAGLADRRHEPLLGSAAGTLRFDLANDGRTDHWLVRIAKGGLRISRGRSRADCTVLVNADQFEAIVTGRLNAMTAMLRGVLAVDGDYGLLVRFQRLFPPPVAAPAGSRERTAGRQRR
jgi:putative sterol carrier protein